MRLGLAMVLAGKGAVVFAIARLRCFEVGWDCRGHCGAVCSLRYGRW